MPTNPVFSRGLRSGLMLAAVLTLLSACERRAPPEVPPPSQGNSTPGTTSPTPEPPASSASM